MHNLCNSAEFHLCLLFVVSLIAIGLVMLCMLCCILVEIS